MKMTYPNDFWTSIVWRSVIEKSKVIKVNTYGGGERRQKNLGHLKNFFAAVLQKQSAIQ